MKVLKYWRELAIVILVIIVVFSVKQCGSKNAVIKTLVNSRDSAYLKANYYQNKEGEWIGQVKVLALDVKTLRDYGNRIGYENKSLKDQVGKLSRIKARFEGKIESSEVIHVPLKDDSVNVLDTSFDMDRPESEVDGKTFYWSNKFLTLDGLVDNDSVKITYNYGTKFSLTAYTKPTGLFSEPDLVADLYFEDQNMRVQEFKGFVIQQPKKNFFQRPLGHLTIGFVAGAGLATYLFSK